MARSYLLRPLRSGAGGAVPSFSPSRKQSEGSELCPPFFHRIGMDFSDLVRPPPPLPSFPLSFRVVSVRGESRVPPPFFLGKVSRSQMNSGLPPPLPHSWVLLTRKNRHSLPFPPQSLKVGEGAASSLSGKRVQCLSTRRADGVFSSLLFGGDFFLYAPFSFCGRE